MENIDEEKDNSCKLNWAKRKCDLEQVQEQFLDYEDVENQAGRIVLSSTHEYSFQSY